MKRVKLVVAYDGTNYRGWQVQNNGETIESMLNRAISSLTGEEIHGCHICPDCHISHPVTALKMQWFHLGTPIPSVVAARFHGHGKIICPTERRDKQRYQQGNHSLCFLN